MAEYSLYKSLELPSSTEHYNIGVFNKNTTVIDSELHKLDLINESLSNHTTDELNPHKVKKSQIGLSNVDNTSDINKPVSTVQQNAIDEALYQSNYYTDTKIAELINGAPETLDTLKEVADAIEEDKSIVDVLDAAIGTKANQNELNTHINNAVIHVTQSDKNNINIAKEHADSQHARVDATKVEKSDTNGNIKINGVETNVYTPSSSTELPLTTSLDATEEGVAALDSTVGKVLKDEIDELNNNLPQFIYDEEGKITGYKTSGGADTVFPFSSAELIKIEPCIGYGTVNYEYGDNLHPGKYILIQTAFATYSLKSYDFTCNHAPTQSNDFTGSYIYARSYGKVSFFDIDSDTAFTASINAVSGADRDPYVYAELILIKA